MKRMAVTLCIAGAFAASARAQFGPGALETTQLRVYRELILIKEGTDKLPEIDKNSFTTIDRLEAILHELSGQLNAPGGVAAAAPASLTAAATVGVANANPNGTGTPSTTFTQNYGGANLLTLGTNAPVANGAGAGVYLDLPPEAGKNWPDNYRPFSLQESTVDRAVQVVDQADGNVEKLNGSLQAAMRHLAAAKSIGEIEALNARINGIRTELARQEYYRTAAIQNVQLVQISNENNREKREQALAEEKSVQHSRQLGAPLGGNLQGTLNLINVLATLDGSAGTTNIQ